MNERICVAVLSRNETLLCRTVHRLFVRAYDPDRIEVNVILDGWDLESNSKVNPIEAEIYKHQVHGIKEMAAKDSRIVIHELEKPHGVRHGANRAAALTDCDYIIKCDAHIEFSQNYDLHFLQCYKWAGHESLIIPSICSMDPENDYRYGERRFEFLLINPDMHQEHWFGYAKRPEAKGDCVEVMSNLGAVWFTSRQYWWQIELHDEETFGTWGESAPETSLKVWLSGGRMILNRNVLYAHVFRRTFPYSINGNMVVKNKTRTKEYWLNEEYPYQIHPVSWLVGKFWPVPKWENGTICHRINAK